MQFGMAIERKVFISCVKAHFSGWIEKALIIQWAPTVSVDTMPESISDRTDRSARTDWHRTEDADFLPSKTTKVSFCVHLNFVHEWTPKVMQIVRGRVVMPTRVSYFSCR